MIIILWVWVGITVYVALGISWVCGLRRFRAEFCAFDSYPNDCADKKLCNITTPVQAGWGVIFWVVSFVTYLMYWFIRALIPTIYHGVCRPIEALGAVLIKFCK